MILLFTLSLLNICIYLFRSFINAQRRIQILFLFRFTFWTLITTLKLLNIIMLTSICGKLNFDFTCIRLSNLHDCFTLFFTFYCFKFTRLLLYFSTFVSNTFILLDHRIAAITFKNLIIVRYRFYI